MNTRRAAIETIDDIEQTLHYLLQSGWRGFDCPQRCFAVMENWGQAPAKRQETLEDIRADLGDCRRCKLWTKRNNIVFGVGDPGARLVFVGEGPGYDEDQQGEPFVGAAGRLLTRIIAAMGLSRDQVYICNIIKCRPPGNRNPEADEIETCSPFLKRQLKAITPDFICALGTFASQTILESHDPISRLRGRLHDCMGIKVLATYHPAYLLRNPDKKRDVWEDMKLLMKAMGLPLPQK